MPPLGEHVTAANVTDDRTLLLCDEDHRRWAQDLADRLIGAGCPARVLNFDHRSDQPSVLDEELRAAATLVLLRSIDSAESPVWQRERDVMLLLAAAARKRTVTVQVDETAPDDDLPGIHLVIPADMATSSFDTGFARLVQAIREPFTPDDRVAMVLIQKDKLFDAITKRLPQDHMRRRYRNRTIWVGRTSDGKRIIVANSSSHRGTAPPVDLFRPQTLVVAGKGESVDPAQRIVCDSSNLDLSSLHGLQLVPPLVVDHIKITGGEEWTGQSSVVLPLHDAEAVEQFDLPMVRIAAIGLDLDATADAIHEIVRRILAPPAGSRPDAGVVAFGDRPAKQDSLSRTELARALVKVLLLREGDDPPKSGSTKTKKKSGPTVVSLEAPWGAGKTSMFNLITEALRDEENDRDAETEASVPTTPRSAKIWQLTTGVIRRSWAWVWRADRFGGRVRVGRKLTVCAAAWHMWKRQATDPAPDDLTEVTGSRWITVGFNPWSHLAGEEVWAGLSNSIQDAIVAKICRSDGSPKIDDNRRERYWFRRNIQRLDRRRLTLGLHRRIASPIYKVSLFAVAVPILAQVVAKQPVGDVPLPEWLPWISTSMPPLQFTLFFAAVLVGAGALHTALRFCLGRASKFLPSDLFHAPTLDGALLGASTLSGDDASIKDPHHRFRTGQLAVRQRTFQEIQTDLEGIGYELLVLVDDLDRCSPRRTALVFEAINDFLSGEFRCARFVLAIDAHVVAAHLQSAFTAADKAIGFAMPDDPQIGWTFLRKLIQLPVVLPAVDEAGWSKALEDLLGQARVRAQTTTGDDVNGGGLEVTASTAGNGAGTDDDGRRPNSTLTAAAEQRAFRGRKGPPLDLESNETVRQLMLRRCTEQPTCTIRELKRLLNVWHLYVRLLFDADGHWPTDVDRQTELACDLVILAEIVTRWPAFQTRLHRRFDSKPGLRLLATAARGDKVEWALELHKVGLGTEQQSPAHRPGIAALRKLLKEHGRAIERLPNLVL
jgi:hypothetical protein